MAHFAVITGSVCAEISGSVCSEIFKQVFNQNANEDDRKKCLKKLLNFEVEVEERLAQIKQAENKEQKGKQLIKEAEKLRSGK